MREQADGTNRRQLRRMWRDWTNVVEKFARNSLGRHAVDPVQYRELYRALLEACQPKPGLADLVRPWMSPKALEHTPAGILLDLLTRCRQVEQELSGGGWLPRGRLGLRWAFLTLAAVLVGAAVGAAFLGDTPAPEVLANLRDRARMSVGLKPIEWAAVVGIGVSVVTGFLVARTART